MGINVSKRVAVVECLRAQYGDNDVTRREILEATKAAGLAFPYWITNDDDNKVDRGLYRIPDVGDASSVPVKKAAARPAKVAAAAPLNKSAQVIPIDSVSQTQLNVNVASFVENLVPKKDPLYVPFGHHNSIKKIVESGMFYPVFITGLSGNGKTYMVQQVMAMTKNKVIRVNLTAETDEDDLIGGFRLVNGETKFFKGPVIRAMEEGATLLLDEIDLVNPARVMCLQSILEGSGYFIKKTGEFVGITEGFNVIATANTKGRGSSDGRFIGTNVLNEAFLERFPVTFEQPYPKPAVEKRILKKLFESLEIDDQEFLEKLVDWADIVRTAFFDGAVDEIISTRRLVHISKSYKIFGDRMAAIDMCIDRFDEDTKFSFRELYSKLDENVTTEKTETNDDELATVEERPF